MPEVGFDTGLATLLVESIGWSLLHFLWQGAAIAAAYALARLLLQRSAPQLRLWTGYLALLGLATAPLLTFASHFLQGHAGAVQLPAAAAHASARATAAVADSSGGIPTLIDAALPWLVAAWLLGVLEIAAQLTNDSDRIGVEQVREATPWNIRANAALLPASGLAGLRAWVRGAFRRS